MSNPARTLSDDDIAAAAREYRDEEQAVRQVEAEEHWQKWWATADFAGAGEDDLIVLMFRCYDALRQRGWKDAMYAPADGHLIEVIEAGSTGIHKATRDEKRRFWVHDEFDSWPSDPVLFRGVTQ